MQNLGYGSGYRYAHDDYATMQHAQGRPPAQRLQEYLPDNLAGRRYYEPGDQGAEGRLSAWIRERRGET